MGKKYGFVFLFLKKEIKKEIKKVNPDNQTTRIIFFLSFPSMTKLTTFDMSNDITKDYDGGDGGSATSFFPSSSSSAAGDGVGPMMLQMAHLLGQMEQKHVHPNRKGWYFVS